MELTSLKAALPPRAKRVSFSKDEARGSVPQSSLTEDTGAEAMGEASRFQRRASSSLATPLARSTSSFSRVTPEGYDSHPSLVFSSSKAPGISGTRRQTSSPSFESSGADSGAAAFTMAIPKDASRFLLRPLDAQRQQQLAFALSHDELKLEEVDKQSRLGLMRYQQARRAMWTQASAAALSDMLKIWESVSLAVRDRISSLQPAGYQTFAFPDGAAIYEGYWKNFYPNGKGCLRRSKPIDDLYEGQWFMGQRYGTGTYHSSEYHVLYQGSWLDDKMHGRGELVEPEGVYTGEFVENSLHGYGEYVYNDGHVYKGDWVRGLYEGNGIYIYPSGTKYEGGWLRGCEHGRGTKLFSNGDMYIGEWKHGMPHGYGCFTSSCSTASRVTGQWRYGSLHGQATCVFADGGHYVGEWQRGQFHGHGTYNFSDSNGELQSYTGTYVNGKRHGYGEYTSSTVSYTGEWTQDKKDGEGSLQIRGGGVYQGRWKDDVPDGEGVFISMLPESYNEPMNCEATDGTFIACVDHSTQSRVDLRLLGR